MNYGEQVQTVQMPVNLGQPQLRPVRARITHVNWLWGWESQSLDSRGRRVEAEGESVSHAAHELLRDQRRSRRRRAARTLGHIEDPVVETAQLQQRPVKYNSTSIA